VSEEGEQEEIAESYSYSRGHLLASKSPKVRENLYVQHHPIQKHDRDILEE